MRVALAISVYITAEKKNTQFNAKITPKTHNKRSLYLTAEKAFFGPHNVLQ